MTEASENNPMDLTADPYEAALMEVSEMLEAARREAVRAINTLMTVTYWEIGRRIVELEQHGTERAEYGKQIIERLAQDLSPKFGRGFKKSNLFQMRKASLSRRQRSTLPIRMQHKRYLEKPLTFSKHCLENSHCPGRTTSNCFRLKTQKLAKTVTHRGAVV